VYLIYIPFWALNPVHVFREIRILLRRMTSSGMLSRVALVRTDVSEEIRASIIRVTRISELGTTLAVPGNLCQLPVRVRVLQSPKTSP
jgi:hypothetical protein